MAAALTRRVDSPMGRWGAEERGTVTTVKRSKGAKVVRRKASASAKKSVVRKATGRVHTKSSAMKAIR